MGQNTESEGLVLKFACRPGLPKTGAGARIGIRAVRSCPDAGKTCDCPNRGIFQVVASAPPPGTPGLSAKKRMWVGAAGSSVLNGRADSFPRPLHRDYAKGKSQHRSKETGGIVAKLGSVRQKVTRCIGCRRVGMLCHVD